MDNSVLLILAIVLFLLALGVFAVAGFLFLRSQSGGGAHQAQPQPPSSHHVSTGNPVSRSGARQGGVEVNQPPPAPDLPGDGSSDYADEEMPTVIVSQPPQMTRPGGAAGMENEGGAKPNKRTAGATIIAFDDDDEDD